MYLSNTDFLALIYSKFQQSAAGAEKNKNEKKNMKLITVHILRFFFSVAKSIIKCSLTLTLYQSAIFVCISTVFKIN